MVRLEAEMSTICALAWVLLAGSSSPVQGHSFVKMDFRRADVAVDPGNWKLSMGGKEFQCVKKGEPSNQPQVVSDAEVGKAIRIKLEPSYGKGPDNGRDKINYAVVKGHDPNAPTFDGRMVYYTFKMKL